MCRRDRAFLFLATLWLCVGVARAETPRDGAAPRSPQEEKRRKLLEEIGLDKKDAPPPRPSVSSPAPSQNGETAPATSAPQDQRRRSSATDGMARATTPVTPSFRRTIHPLLIATCGSCHRPGGPAAATRFMLGGDAVTDHATVSQLITIRDPASSVLLVKVSGQPHAGGSLWPVGSDNYLRVLSWIAKGACLDVLPTVESPAAAPVSRRSVPSAAVAVVVPAPPPSPLPSPPIAAPSAPIVRPAPVPAPAPARSDFASTVHPILMATCAPCHRANAPAATTRLVLSGDAATDEARVRPLVDAAAPDRSPLVVKASGEMHGGGSVISVGDASYRALVAWAAQPPAAPAAVPPPASQSPVSSASPIAPVVAAAPVGRRPEHDHHGGVALPLGFLLNGRFDLAYERRQFSGDPFGSEATNALRSYHHFLFLSRASSDGDPCGVSVEILTLQFWEANCRIVGHSHPVTLTVAGGKILVPFGADPLYHQSYGGLAGFDQRILPVIWAEEGVAAHLVHQHGDFVFSDDLFAVRGYVLAHADGILNLQNDFSPVDDAKVGWGNRVGAAWRGVSAWYSAYFNPLGFGRHLFMQAVDVTVWRQRSIPVVGHFSLGAGLLRADVAGGDADGVGGAGKDYYHFGSYLQLRYHPTDWVFLQYRQGLRTFNNRRGLIVDNSRLTNADGSTHNFGVVGRYRGLTAGIFYFINLEKVDEIPDDLFRVSIAYDF